MLPTTNHELLPENEIRELIRKYQETKDVNEKAVYSGEIIAHNERLIFRTASRYYCTGLFGDQELDDLQQLGRYGALKAIDQFDLSKNIKFTTYAFWWIRMYITRYGRTGQAISMSQQGRIKQSQILKAQSIFTQTHHRAPTTAELSEITGIPEKKILQLHTIVVSLDEITGAPDSKDTLGDVVGDPESNTEIAGENSVLLERIKVKMDKLPERDQQIISLTFGLNGEQPSSLRKVARRMSMSPEGVRKVLNSAIIRLREKTLFD